MKDLFCSPELAKEIFLETRHFVAIPDIRPILPGHSLIVPKRHVLGMPDLTDDELVDLGVILRRLVPELLKMYKTDSYHLSVNSGRHSGMSIPHLHMHVVPRSAGDTYIKKHLTEFYDDLGAETAPLAANFEEELKKMRKIFKYEPAKQEG
ncbi:HIT domain protein [uncultured archaeon]|nr:HIT domain protein [uncultured archaeon]